LFRFETERSYSFLLNGHRADGTPLPFGASVFDDEGRHVGHVSQGGQGLIRVQQREGGLTVRWGGDADQMCRFGYAIPEQLPLADGTGPSFRRVDALCRGYAVRVGEVEVEEEGR